jgi:cardiolipin synthase
VGAGIDPGAASTRRAAAGDVPPQRDDGHPQSDDAMSSHQILTVPNALSVLRLVGVPAFLALIFTEHDGWALLVLMVAGITDYLDGKIARRWGQVSRLGQILDPAADRLYIIATLVGLTARDIIPLWLALAVVGRDVVLSAILPVLRRHGYGPPPVHFLGKAATFNLLYAFPLLLLGDGGSRLATLADVFGWAFAIWGLSLYWWSAGLYVVQVRQLVGASRLETLPVERS